ncbi:hypothetical protein CE91St49_39740 [Emergencia timonensis]|nr:hypothetical protein CE91St48_39840 [Emergencia timonensis]BDF14627.1 hypothetical protein CE91St49_39740 [Emergencia timonensis]
MSYHGKKYFSHFFSWIGVITFTIFIVLETSGLADSGTAEAIASFCCGGSFGVLIIAVIYTNRYLYKFKASKKDYFSISKQ